MNRQAPIILLSGELLGNRDGWEGHFLAGDVEFAEGERDPAKIALANKNYAQWERQLSEKHAKDSRGQEKEAYDTAAMRQGEVDAWARYGLTGSHDDEECQCPNCVAASVRGRELEAQLSATQLEATQLAEAAELCDGRHPDSW